MNRALLALVPSALLLCAQAAPVKPQTAATRVHRDVAGLAANFVGRRYKLLGIKFERQTFPILKSIEVEEGKAFTGKGDGQQPPLQWGKDIEATSFSGNGTFNSKALAFAGYGIQTGDYNDFNGVDFTSKVIIIARELPDIPAFAALKPEERSLRGRLRRFETARIGGLILLDEGDAPSPLKLMPEIPTFPYPVVSIPARALEPVCGDLKARLKKIRETGQSQSVDFVWAPWSYLGLTLEMERKEVDAPNIIATIPGTDPSLKGEVIVLGAHLNHQGQAGDNASGTALLLELAKSLKSAKPRRTILLIHFSGEKEGLLGSAHWIKNPSVPIESVKAMLAFERGDRMDLKHFTLAKIPTVDFFTELHADKLSGEGTAKVAAYARKVVLDIANAEKTPAFEAAKLKVRQ